MKIDNVDMIVLAEQASTSHNTCTMQLNNSVLESFYTSVDNANKIALGEY